MDSLGMRRFVWYACGMPRLVSGGIPEAILSYGGRSLQMKTGTGDMFSIPCSCRATSCVHGFRAFALLFVVALFGLDAQRSVRYDFESLFRNQFARFAAYSVGLVLDTHESRFEMLYEFELSLGEPARLLFRELSLIHI